uniref:Digestive organ expansion factor-like protein n=1 Tax=Aegilops tauschii TaxID=37682 RepID=M8CE41_AEGTA
MGDGDVGSAIVGEAGAIGRMDKGSTGGRKSEKRDPPLRSSNSSEDRSQILQQRNKDKDPLDSWPAAQQRKSVKLYSNFYASDIIVASPLALKLEVNTWIDSEVLAYVAIANNFGRKVFLRKERLWKKGVWGREKIDGGEVTKKKGRPKENDSDFLSSIEIVVVDYADVISMQNWSHLHAVLEQLNHLPSKEHVTNVMRIRPWYLDEHARYYRQTIILSSYLTPEMNALFNGLCLNYEGKVKLVTEFTGVLPKIQLEIRQVYERFDASSIGESDDARFEYFCTKVYPKIQESDAGGVLLFASSYFEYIRLSNFLKSQDASFCRIGEATSQQDISRARLWFFEGQKKILLYSERSHFFHRYKIRGGHHLVIYSLPGRKDFYPELVNMLGESANPRCNVLFSRLDLLKVTFDHIAQFIYHSYHENYSRLWILNSDLQRFDLLFGIGTNRRGMFCAEADLFRQGYVRLLLTHGRALALIVLSPMP